MKLGRVPLAQYLYVHTPLRQYTPHVTPRRRNGTSNFYKRKKLPSPPAPRIRNFELIWRAIILNNLLVHWKDRRKSLCWQYTFCRKIFTIHSIVLFITSFSQDRWGPIINDRRKLSRSQTVERTGQALCRIWFRRTWMRLCRETARGFFIRYCNYKSESNLQPENFQGDQVCLPLYTNYLSQ